jgi:hypothetical protein
MKRTWEDQRIIQITNTWQECLFATQRVESLSFVQTKFKERIKGNMNRPNHLMLLEIIF